MVYHCGIYHACSDKFDLEVKLQAITDVFLVSIIESGKALSNNYLKQGGGGWGEGVLIRYTI